MKAQHLVYIIFLKSAISENYGYVWLIVWSFFKNNFSCELEVVAGSSKSRFISLKDNWGGSLEIFTFQFFRLFQYILTYANCVGSLLESEYIGISFSFIGKVGTLNNF